MFEEFRKKRNAGRQKRQAILKIAKQSGLPYQKIKKMLEDAQKNYLIDSDAFQDNRLWECSEKEREKEYALAAPAGNGIKSKYCISILMSTGMSESEAEAAIKNIRRKTGITYNDYIRYDFYKLPEQEQLVKYRRLIGDGKIEKKEAYEEAIIRTVIATGWNRKKAIADISRAKSKYRIKPKEYFLNRFYKIPEEERPAYAEKILKERSKVAAHKLAVSEGKKAKYEAYVQQVSEETGWAREKTIEEFKRARRACGASAENYAIFDFCNMTPEEQSAFFTQGYNQEVIRKYSSEQVGIRRIMFYKDLFYEEFDQYLGRKWLLTAGMEYQTFKDTFRDAGRIIFKPRDGVGGHGITVFDVDEESLMREAFEEILSQPFGVVETYLHQHPKMQQLSVKSVNTIRLVTIRSNDPDKNIETGKVHFVYGGLRMSTNDNYVDNLHSGGAIAALDVESGKLITPAANHLHEVYITHPVTGVQIPGFEIPYFAEAKSLVEKAIIEKDIEGYYGWDVAITVDGPVLIEGNNNPGSDGLQIPYVPEHKGMRYLYDYFMK